MPFDFLKRKGPSAGAAGKAADGLAGVGTRGVPFDGLTEEWRIIGTMEISGRLSDALNKREVLAISDVQWTPIEVEEPFTPAPGLKSIDPYDLIIVMAGAATQPPLTESERAAYKVHKVGFDVALEAPPFRMLGTIYLYPGSEPSRLLDRGTEMFVPVVDATGFVGDRSIMAATEAILVNRFYLRGVEQIDKRTGERVQELPGAPLGGVSWQRRD